MPDSTANTLWKLEAASADTITLSCPVCFQRTTKPLEAVLNDVQCDHCPYSGLVMVGSLPDAIVEQIGAIVSGRERLVPDIRAVVDAEFRNRVLQPEAEWALLAASFYPTFSVEPCEGTFMGRARRHDNGSLEIIVGEVSRDENARLSALAYMLHKQHISGAPFNVMLDWFGPHGQARAEKMTVEQMNGPLHGMVSMVLRPVTGQRPTPHDALVILFDHFEARLAGAGFGPQDIQILRTALTEAIANSGVSVNYSRG